MVKYYQIHSWYSIRKLRYILWTQGKSHILKNKSDRRIKNELMYNAMMARRDIFGIEPDGKVLTQIVQELRSSKC